MTFVCAFQLLLNPEMVKACPTLIPYVYDFLENKAYSKGKGEFARKVNKCFSVIYLLPNNCKYIIDIVRILVGQTYECILLITIK